MNKERHPLAVIPDAAKRRSGIHNPYAEDLNAAGYGFRARAFGAPRNDDESHPINTSTTPPTVSAVPTTSRHVILTLPRKSTLSPTVNNG